ncbi:unnamed protein product, partial [Mesorhabditis belari]|uniref:Uncharacterized protein n=1 Tax=Mesorhabditis belari TaxID=2138241 RepID=A0AAF3ED83_9BILA
MSDDELGQFKEIFISCDSDPCSSRYLRVSSLWPRIIGWNETRWIPRKTLEWAEFSDHKKEDECQRRVLKYYSDHQKKLKRIIHSTKGQMIVERETGVVGGSIILYVPFDNWESAERRAQHMQEIIRAFLLLVLAFNGGEGLVEKRGVQISLKTYDVQPDSRIKIMTDTMDTKDLLLKIYYVLASDPSIPPLFFRHKTLVATYLHFSQMVSNRFTPFFEGYTWELERLRENDEENRDEELSNCIHSTKEAKRRVLHRVSSVLIQSVSFKKCWLKNHSKDCRTL